MFKVSSFEIFSVSIYNFAAVWFLKRNRSSWAVPNKRNSCRKNNINNISEISCAVLCESMKSHREKVHSVAEKIIAFLYWTNGDGWWRLFKEFFGLLSPLHSVASVFIDYCKWTGYGGNQNLVKCVWVTLLSKT